MYEFVPVAKCLRLYNVVKMCLYMALYLVVNGPERSSRFYVFYNESIYIYITATIGYSLFSS